MEPSLTQVFGVGATQTATTITISKADLPSLTASSSNRAESLLVAILLKAQMGLPRTSFDTDIDQSIYIESGFPTFSIRGENNASYRTDQLTINLAKPDTGVILDPDDY
jgi:hypothetical protein